MATALISMGSNLGDRAKTLECALELMAGNPQVTSVTASRSYETLPIGGPSGQGAFLNAAAKIETSLEPDALLILLLQIEGQLGRTRDVRWDQRTLDLDLLLYDDLVTKNEFLEVPHPLMACRRFVLEPAAQVAPQMIHPVLSRSVESLLEHLEQAVPYAAMMGGNREMRSKLAHRLTTTVNRQALGHVGDPGNSLTEDDPSDSTPLNRTSRTGAQWLKFLYNREWIIEGWPHPGIWGVTEFWLGEVCLAFHDGVSESEQAAISGAWWQAQRKSTPAKLVLVLDPDRQFDVATIASYWRKLTSQPLMPVVLLQSPDLDIQVGYAAAAMEAMQ